jgi:predicted fused transcriptional regulator/phosphomethylpyrimidine kinase
MKTGSIILVGGPASGKTNYIARLWLSFAAKKGKLRAKHLPGNIEYVNQAVAHLQSRQFAPRSDKNMDESGRRDFSIEVCGAGHHRRAVETGDQDIRTAAGLG